MDEILNGIMNSDAAWEWLANNGLDDHGFDTERAWRDAAFRIACEAYTKGRESFYRFPKLTAVDTYSKRQAHEKIGEELLEAVAARNANDYVMELLDIIHACETALRMTATEDEVMWVRDLVIKKNNERGYYDWGII